MIDERGCEISHGVEFEADGPESALQAANRLGTSRPVTIFEDGRPIARVRTVQGAGGWVINPPLLGPRTA